MTISEAILRPIRSYVLRQGRMTPSQRAALTDYWAQYGLTVTPDIKPMVWQEIFGREAPCHLEIGFGMGNSLLAMAKAHPECDFIGIEVHQPGVGRCLAKAQDLKLTNLKIFADDALTVLERCVGSASLDKILLLFPDPWPKLKHHKRRIVQPAFAQLIAQKLKPQGRFQLATDWQPYADHMLTTLDACPVLMNDFGKGHFAPSGFERLTTKFELRGQKLGHSIWDLVYRRV